MIVFFNPNTANIHVYHPLIAGAGYPIKSDLALNEISRYTDLRGSNLGMQPIRVAEGLRQEADNSEVMLYSGGTCLFTLAGEIFACIANSHEIIASNDLRPVTHPPLIPKCKTLLEIMDYYKPEVESSAPTKLVLSRLRKTNNPDIFVVKSDKNDIFIYTVKGRRILTKYTQKDIQLMQSLQKGGSL